MKELEKVMTTDTQRGRILVYLRENGSITSFEAWTKLGVARLASRISELRHQYGYKIDDEWIEIENKFGEICRVKRYRLGA